MNTVLRLVRKLVAIMCAAIWAYMLYCLQDNQAYLNWDVWGWLLMVPFLLFACPITTWGWWTNFIWE